LIDMSYVSCRNFDGSYKKFLCLTGPGIVGCTMDNGAVGEIIEIQEISLSSSLLAAIFAKTLHHHHRF